MTRRDSLWNKYTPWALVRERFFDGRSPGVLGFSTKHRLNAVEVLNLFSGATNHFSYEMCAALSRETQMSHAFFQNLSNRWQPDVPPAHSAALPRAAFFLAQPQSSNNLVKFLLKIYPQKCEVSNICCFFL